MSQLRAHRTPSRNEKPSSRARSSVKAAGDAVQREKNEDQSKSRSKIPKTIRYELESALVGLCDVWFSEIKPHLVRNNIKLHVNHSPPAAGGDQETIPPGAPGCCHLDPGAASDRQPVASANCAAYYTTRRTVSTAPYHKQQAPAPSRSQQHQPARVLPSQGYWKLQGVNTLVDIPSVEQPTTQRCRQIPKTYDDTPRKIGRRRRVLPAQDWRSPRACRTYSIMPPPGARFPPRARTADQIINTRSKLRRKKTNSGTQTDETLIMPKTTNKSKLDINLLPTKTKVTRKQDRVKKKCKVSKFSAPPPPQKVKVPLWPSLRSVSPLKSPDECYRQSNTSRTRRNQNKDKTMSNLHCRRWETNTTLRPGYKPCDDDYSSLWPITARTANQTVKRPGNFGTKRSSNQRHSNSGAQTPRTPHIDTCQSKTEDVEKPLFSESLVDVIDHNFQNCVDVLYESSNNREKRSEFNLVMKVDNSFKRRPWK